MDIIKTKLEYDQKTIQEIEDKLSQKYDFIYDAFEAVAIKGTDILSSLELKPEVIEALNMRVKKYKYPILK